MANVLHLARGGDERTTLLARLDRRLKFFTTAQLRLAEVWLVHISTLGSIRNAAHGIQRARRRLADRRHTSAAAILVRLVVAFNADADTDFLEAMHEAQTFYVQQQHET